MRGAAAYIAFAGHEKGNLEDHHVRITNMAKVMHDGLQ